MSADTRKATEIEQAWALHQAATRLTDLRRDWLCRHIDRQNGLCHYCGVKFDKGERDPMMRPTLDHFVPLSKDGADDFDNTVAACLLCNSAKGDMMPEEVAANLPAARVRILEGRDKRFSWRPDKRYRW